MKQSETCRHDGLAFPSKGTRERKSESSQERLERQKAIADAIRTILLNIGEDPEREGLLKTPDRYAKALLYFSKGYEDTVDGNASAHIVCI
jgi:GTP cyclohydrolase I